MKTAHHILFLFLTLSVPYWSIAQGGGNNSGQGGGPPTADTTAADSLETQVYWEDLQNVSYNEQTGMLTKTGADGWMHSGAVGKNILESGKNGYISYKIPALQREYTLGLSSLQKVENHRNADYAFLVEDKSLSIIESGTVVKQVNGNLKATDELKIERTGSEIRYLKNGQMLKATPTNPSFELRPQAGLNKKGEMMPKVRTHIAAQPRMNMEATDANCITGILGKLFITIDLDPKQHRIQSFLVQNLTTGQKVFHAILFISPHIELEIPDLFPGDYLATLQISQESISGSSLRTLEKKATIRASTLDVQNHQGMKEKPGGGLVKEKPDGWGNAGLETRPIVSPGQDGKFSYRVAPFDGEMAIGMGSASHNNHFNSIEYTFFISEQGLSIMESGQLKSHTPGIKEGDMLTMERQGSVIRYKKNDLVLKESMANPTKELKVQASLFKQNSIARPILIANCFDTPDPRIQYFAISNGNWTDPANWSTESHTSTVNKGTYPGPSDWVSIKDHSITINSEAAADVIIADDPKVFNTQISIENGGILTTRLLSFISGISAMQAGGTGGDKSLKLILQGNGQLNVTERFSLNKRAGVGDVLINAADQSRVAIGKQLSISYADGTKGISVTLSGNSEMFASNILLFTSNLAGKKKISVTASDNAKIKASGDIVFNSVQGAAGINLNGNSTLEIGGNFFRNNNSGSLNMDLAGNTTVIYSGTGDQLLAADQLPVTTDKFTYNNVTLSKPSGSIALEGEVSVNGTLNLGDNELSIGSNTLSLLNTNADAIQTNDGIITHSDGGKLVRFTETTSDYVFPLSNKNGDEIIFTRIDLTPGSAARQGFAMNVKNIDGVSLVLHEKSAAITGSQTVNLKVKANLAADLMLKFDFDPDFNVTNMKYFDIRTNNYEPLDPEFFVFDKNQATLSFTSIKAIGIRGGVLIPPTATEFNWEHTIVYGESGAVVAENKQHFDLLGRPTQTHVKNLTEGIVLTSQTVYDTYGRAAIQTLPAPSGTTLDYKQKFITNASGNNDYNYVHFDVPGTLNSAAPVRKLQSNTLGYQYSDIGEQYVATTDIPYYRTEYTADPMSEVKRTAQPGNEQHMGKGHEARIFNMYSAGELAAVFGTDKSYKVTTDATDRLINSAITQTGGIIAKKTIAIDGDGNEQITYTAGGKPIASCISGKASACNFQDAVTRLKYRGNRSVDIHLPAANKGDLEFPLPSYSFDFPGDPLNPPVHIDYQVQPADIFYKISDLNTNEALDEGVDYSIATDRSVTFLGKYATGSSYFRISVDFSQAIKNTFIAPSDFFSPPDTYIEYKLDYSNWSINLYDLAGRLRKIVSPKDIDCNDATLWAAKPATTFDYDPFGNLISKQTPDEGRIDLLFDSENKIRFSQNAVQQANNEFSYINYDKHGRTVETGVFNENGGLEFQNYYQTAGANNVQTILNQLDGLNDFYCSEKTLLLYDRVNTTAQIPSGYSFKNNYFQRYLAGRVTKSMNEQTATWYSYDQFGKTTFVVQQFLDGDYIALEPLVNDKIKTIDYEYNLSTGALNNKTYQKYSAQEKLTHAYLYDADQRVIGTMATDGFGAEAAKVHYEYYLDGRMKRKEIGNNLQGMDYVYTIGGQLKSINHPSLDAARDPGKDGTTGSPFPADVFGMSIDYFANDYARTGTDINSFTSNDYPGHHNGLVNSIRWKNSVSNQVNRSGAGLGNVDLYTAGSAASELAMLFKYDDLNRLAKSKFAVYNNTGNSATERNEFSVLGKQNGNIGYDANGNITFLFTNGYADVNNSYEMDELSYTYPANNNRLAAIADNAVTAVSYDDFKTTGADNYTYNALGQLTSSEADKLASATYFANGKTKKVIFTNGNTAEYFYSDKGAKSKTKFTDMNTAGNPTLITWYLNDEGGNMAAIYTRDETSSAPNDIVLTEQPVYCLGRAGILNKTNGKTTYEITDHLGNVRVTVSESSGTLAVESWADYYPHGNVMPGRNGTPSAYRFNYQGQENAVASRWKNFDLRMYSSDIGRFLTPDPYSQYHSAYLAMGNNPANRIDPGGGYDLDVTTQQGKDAWTRRMFEQDRDVFGNRNVHARVRDEIGGGDPFANMDELMARAERNWANHISLREANIALDQLYALGTAEATAAAWELQEAIENFEIETMYGFTPITHGGMGADNQPVDILGESSSATINAEMNEAIVTIVVEESRKEQMQALQGQMLASMGAVKFDVGLSEMAGIQDPGYPRSATPDEFYKGMIDEATFMVTPNTTISGDNYPMGDFVEMISGGDRFFNLESPSVKPGMGIPGKWSVNLNQYYGTKQIIGDQITIRITAGPWEKKSKVPGAGGPGTGWNYTIYNGALIGDPYRGFGTRPSTD